MDAVDCTVTGNKITGKDVDPDDPQLDTANYDGIYLTKGSIAKKISRNTISGMNGYGIDLYKSCRVSGEISGNSISGCEDGGILVYKDSEVTGSISGNVVSDTKGYGIFVTTGSKVDGSIKYNVVSKTKKSGIHVYSGSIVGGDILANQVTNAKGYGIRIYKASVVAGGISSNKITSAGESGIYIYDDSGKSTAGEIKNNIIENPGWYGIDMESTKNNVSISGNKVSGCVGNSVVVHVSSYRVTIRNNTIDGTTYAKGVSK
jgi:parallel beta-helix repeat protein